MMSNLDYDIIQYILLFNANEEDIRTYKQINKHFNKNLGFKNIANLVITSNNLYLLKCNFKNIEVLLDYNNPFI